MSKRGVFVVGALGCLSFSEAVTAHMCQAIELAESESGPTATTQTLCAHLEDIFSPHNHRDDEADETDKIVKACDAYTPKHNALRLKALVLLMLNSGLRIGDAVNLERSKIADGRLTLRTQKKNVHVSLPLPPDVVAALDALPATSTFFFTTGEAQPKAVVGNYQNYLRKLFKLATVSGDYPHKFRHTFAARLLSPAGSCGKCVENPRPQFNQGHSAALFPVDKRAAGTAG